jgi:hypothetical protein
MDEDIKDNEATERPEEEKETPKTPREPTGNDYMAGVFLANGIIWLWMYSLSMFSGFMSRIPAAILADFSYVTYIVGGFIASQQVAKRSEKNQLIVALRTSFYAWLGSLLIIITTPSVSTVSFAVTLLVCLLIGGVAGSYMLIRERIIARRERLRASS